MSDPVMVRPIGVVSGGRGEILGDHWGAVVSHLILDLKPFAGETGRVAGRAG